MEGIELSEMIPGVVSNITETLGSPIPSVGGGTIIDKIVIVVLAILIINH